MSLPVLAVLLICLVTGTGCAARKVKPDRASFDEGFAAFQAGQWQRAIDCFNRYLRSDPTTPTRGEVYYYRGEAYVRLKNRRAALADFERCLGAGAPPPIEDFAYVAIGNLHYEEGNDARAVEAYSHVCGKKQKNLPLDQVCLRLGVSLQRLGRWQAADKYLNYLIDAFPESALVTEARRRLHCDAFVVQVGAFVSPVTAEAEADRLRAAGFSPRVTRTLRGSQTLYAVQVGRASTYAEAERLAGRLAQAGFKTLIVP